MVSSLKGKKHEEIMQHLEGNYKFGEAGIVETLYQFREIVDKYNKASSDQSEKMLKLTKEIKWLTKGMYILAIITTMIAVSTYIAVYLLTK